MVLLKSCQRCGGDLYTESDQFGSYVSCFQCGASVVNVYEKVSDGEANDSVDVAVAQVNSARS